MPPHMDEHERETGVAVPDRSASEAGRAVAPEAVPGVVPGSPAWALGLQRSAGNHATTHAVRRLARQGGHATVTPGAGTFRRASTINEYVDLIREAERRLIAAGVTSVDERIQMLSGIYYGTDWSLDHEVEQSDVRDVAFQIYTARTGQGRDPQPVLGASLFEALKRSQDVPHPTLGKVDIGHLIIGLNARSSWTSRVPDIPSQGATGLEIVTWVGDLGGATAQLARSRLTAPATPASRYFTGRSGTDYGADSNLEGDIAAYVAAAPAGATSAPSLTVPASGSIADALAAYFAAGGVSTNRAKSFLQMLGGAFAGSAITNRADIELLMATKFRDFGRWYAGQRFGATVLASIRPLLADAGRDVAHEFMEWLLRRGAGAVAPPASRGSTPAPASPDEDWMDRAAEGFDWLRHQI